MVQTGTKSALCTAACPDTGWALQRWDAKTKLWRWVFVGTWSYGNRYLADLKRQLGATDERSGVYRFVRVVKWRCGRRKKLKRGFSGYWNCAGWRATFDAMVGPLTWTRLPAKLKPKCPGAKSK